ncbi:hypothetical protein [Micromonospora sp. IBHARD004]|uniref:hypothetical protein n=1 Tax=Micromonospora sp. IBHARD004 TaxID=3457764 RepID=UPI0040583328
MSTLPQRYWRGLTGARAVDEKPLAERGREGYGLWRRYWAGLLGIRLPPKDATQPPATRNNPLTEPYVQGARVRLPRFDRAAVRLAASEEPERMVARWAAAGRQFTVRESGPGEVELLVQVDRDVPATEVLPVDVATVGGDRRYFLVFVPETAGGSVGALRLAETSGWIDVTVDEELPVAALEAGDPVTRARIAQSVAATPDPGMATWAEIVASRPADDPLSQVIKDAAG